MEDWRKKEKKDARKFGARQKPRSGGLWFAPGDLATEDFLFDSKLSKHNRFSVTKNMWNKLYKEAIMSQRMPALLVEFGDENTELVVLDRADFESWFEKEGVK